MTVPTTDTTALTTPCEGKARRGRMTPVAARRSLYADRWLPRYRAALLRELSAITRAAVRGALVGMAPEVALNHKLAWTWDLERVKHRWLVPTAAQGYDLAGLELGHQAELKSTEDILAQTAMLGKRRKPLPPAQPGEDPVRVGRPAAPPLRQTGDFLLEGNFDDIDEWIATTSAAEIDTKVRKMRKVWANADASRDPETGLAWTPREIAKDILRQGAADDKVRATMLARTGTIWAMNEGAQQRYSAAGVGAVEWRVSVDDLTCRWCLQMDGRVVRTNDPFWQRGQEMGAEFPLVGGGSRTRFLRFPGDVQHPPLHPNCRCVLIPVLTEQQAYDIRVA